MKNLSIVLALTLLTSSNAFSCSKEEAKAKAEGGWVDYYWTKPGEEAPTPKVSFVKMCPGDKKWIAGSGVWK